MQFVQPFSKSFFDNSFNFTSLDLTVESAIRLAVQEPTKLYLFFQRYTYFNGFVSASIASLAGAIGLSRYSFVDATEPSIEEADRGMEIASHILAAAADEGANDGVCHRSLAQLTLKSLSSYAGLGIEARNKIAQVPQWLKDTSHGVVAAYQGQPNHLKSLIQAMGVHAASELLGDRENAIIDRVVRVEQKKQGFDAYMKHQPKLTLAQNGHRYHPWAYILIHGSHNHQGVEAEHFEHALTALNLCLQYTPSLTAEDVRTYALQGFQQFVVAQQALFQEIYIECQETSRLGTSSVYCLR